MPTPITKQAHYFTAACLLLIATDSNACSPSFPWQLIEDGLTLQEAKITSADLVFHGFLVESRTSALSDEDAAWVEQ